MFRRDAIAARPPGIAGSTKGSARDGEGHARGRHHCDMQMGFPERHADAGAGRARGRGGSAESRRAPPSRTPGAARLRPHREGCRVMGRVRLAVVSTAVLAVSLEFSSFEDLWLPFL